MTIKLTITVNGNRIKVGHIKVTTVIKGRSNKSLPVISLPTDLKRIRNLKAALVKGSNVDYGQEVLKQIIMNCTSTDLTFQMESFLVWNLILKSSSILPSLIEFVKSDEPFVREQALWSVSEIVESSTHKTYFADHLQKQLLISILRDLSSSLSVLRSTLKILFYVMDKEDECVEILPVVITILNEQADEIVLQRASLLMTKLLKFAKTSTLNIYHTKLLSALTPLSQYFFIPNRVVLNQMTLDFM
ncbi:hypothetical protein BC833DRAFT_573164 [Globomyces pollinis-pini]|nr:hypothetical protein BC833DRAFT_573164 [Globomyces pollinis-pini]